ncbi:hypothetical protein OOZ19_09925 [Saccharopolyspora sp. NFXS83]|uniref:hypothetical protein n=1 Tax=Saccharopolyspora sp. NFXS83 TaxID=2993560 RepID=UPI00224A968E|nr:hypothetical protein [Saccharopolyspora sp. NFXS83]MCX2730559.1 hypothetical protein [Saccharopolyspora sp. NFXS83]
MRFPARSRRRWRTLGLLPLPLLAACAVGFGVAAPEPAVGVPARWGSGWLDATATLIPSPPMDQMIAPMPMEHGPEVQIVLQLRNTTGAPVRLSFEDVELRIDDAVGPAEAVAGVGGPRRIRPGGTVEERLRFRAPDGAEHVRLTVPDGDDDITVGLPVRPMEQEPVPPREPEPLGRGHGGH